MKISNYDEIREALVEMLMDLDVEAARYQTDIYLYIREDGSAYLDTYINVGGNSWLNDDHVWIFSHRPAYDDPRDEGYTEEEIREAVENNRNDYLNMAWKILDEAEID